MISVVVLTKNEEKNIERCLESLTWCDEIIVIDDNSIDSTQALAKKYKAKVIQHTLANNFSLQRNFALEQATHEWVLFVDADEVVPQPLAEEIRNLLSQNPVENGFFLKRTDVLWGKALLYGETGYITLLRLGKKSAGTWQGTVHETWHITGKTGTLTNPLIHYPHQSLSEFLKDINWYSSLRAEELYLTGKRVRWWSIIAYPKGKFLYNYIVKQGFRDGTAGMVHAILMSLHSFLVRGKLWQKQNTIADTV